jgi:dTDP-4-amino-4,6-dideoxygalactose transaminase
MIDFNKPHLTGKEAHYMYQAVYQENKISGNGKFTKLCHQFFEQKYGFKKCLLTTSCTDALEMASLLIDTQPGDEIIVPSFTFVSSALAFVRQGAKIIFADSRNDHPGLDESKIEQLVTKKTKAIVVVHYAGIACDLDMIMDIAKRHNLFVIEDAAQAVDSFYKGRPLGGIGHFGCFSFHETKNVNCGEGGMLVINDEKFIPRSEIIWEKGTNRAAFFRGEIDKYGWVDTGSSFLPSDINAAYLYAQLEELENIQKHRINIWEHYYNSMLYLAEAEELGLPVVPSYTTQNGHMFYLLCKSLEKRTELINYLRSEGILAVFHYQSLHNSKYYKTNNENCDLPNSDRYTDCLVRLPLFYDLKQQDLNKIIKAIHVFFKNKK